MTAETNRTLPPIEKQVRVPLPPDEAFRLFTAGLDRWWPVESHSVSARRGQRPRRVVVEPRTGGHVYEVTSDDRRATWATVTRWDEGRALSLDWHVGEDDGATQVTVTFTPDGEGTRVDLVHGDWSASAAARRHAYGSDWTLLLSGYDQTARLRVMA